MSGLQVLEGRLQEATRRVGASFSESGLSIPDFYRYGLGEERPENMGVSMFGHPSETINYELLAESVERLMPDDGDDYFLSHEHVSGINKDKMFLTLPY